MSQFEAELEAGFGENVETSFRLEKAHDEQSLRALVDHSRILSEYREQIRQSQELHKNREARLRHLNRAYALALDLDAAKKPPTDPTIAELQRRIEELSSVSSPD
jgi:hypothetical protein